MKEEIASILAVLGTIVLIILATIILKKFFDNMATSEALSCIFIVIGMLSLVTILVIEYIDYRARDREVP